MFGKFMAESARLAVLDALANAPGFRANEDYLAQLLGKLGFAQSAASLREELNALVEVGAVQLTTCGNLIVVTLRRDGAEHVQGLLTLAGVRRPDAGSLHQGRADGEQPPRAEEVEGSRDQAASTDEPGEAVIALAEAIVAAIRLSRVSMGRFDLVRALLDIVEGVIDAAQKKAGTRS